MTCEAEPGEYPITGDTAENNVKLFGTTGRRKGAKLESHKKKLRDPGMRKIVRKKRGK